MNRTVKLVETHADHRMGPSEDLYAAICREGLSPAFSWLVTKEDGSQAMVVLLWGEPLDPLPPEPKADVGQLSPVWTPTDVTRLIAVATFALVMLACVFAVLSSQA